MSKNKARVYCVCEKCESVFSSRANLCMHSKTCKGVHKVTISCLRRDLETAHSRITELEAQLQSSQVAPKEKAIPQIVATNPKLCDKPSNKPIDFRKESTHYISHDEISDSIKCGSFDDALQRLIVRIYFDSNHSENHTISKNNDGQYMTRTNGVWVKSTLNKIAESICFDTAALMYEHTDDPYSEEYTEQEREEFESWYQNIDTGPESVDRTIQTISTNVATI